MAQPMKPPTLDFSSGHDRRVMRWSPVFGSELSRVSAGDCLPLPLRHPPPAPAHMSPLLQNNHNRNHKENNTYHTENHLDVLATVQLMRVNSYYITENKKINEIK